MLKNQEMDKADAQSVLSSEMKGTIFPFLKKLKTTQTDRSQTQLINILETNLQHLVKLYGGSTNLPYAYQQLTPTEIQVASMVRQGLPTKLIATTLSLSPDTISTHRKHIRKKLGLDCMTNNLHTHLMSLAE
jgi:DNA-binding CsgD family transcriptional regulator